MDGSLLMVGLRGPELDADELAMIQKVQPGGFILFTRNVDSKEQTRRLTDSLRDLCGEDVLIGIDQEGGRVTRTLKIAPALPSAEAFCALPQPDLIGRSGELTADLLQMLGINLNFAPVLDLDHFPDEQNALRQRCWGRNEQDVINRAGVWNRRMRKRGMLSCAKHFPAGGRAKSDPHEDLPKAWGTLEELMKEDIIPYTALMPELDCIMLAHVVYAKIDRRRPASLSKKIVTDWLRNQLGFEKHVLITDDLDMGAIEECGGVGQAAKEAVLAGNDLAMICHDISEVEEAACCIGEISIDRREESYARLDRLRRRVTAPLELTENRWRICCQKIEEIRAAVPEISAADLRSEVTQY